jgi:hypothetical protein
MKPERCGLLVAIVFVAAGCVTSRTGDRETAAILARTPDCRVARSTGDVGVLLRSTGELVIVGGAVELLRSSDLGRSWARESLPVQCRWPHVEEVEGRLVVSCSEAQGLGRLLILKEDDAGRGWLDPVVVDTTNALMIDTNLQRLPDGELLLFATHVDRPDDLDGSIYTVRLYRSFDGGGSWSLPVDVISGRRGEHLEDTRTVVLDQGSLLLVVELERAEGSRSSLLQLESTDGGVVWTDTGFVWKGADVEPGGYVAFADGELWLVASSDAAARGGSYDRALIAVRRSTDNGRSWSHPEVLVDLEDQISFGGVELPTGEILLPSIRHYSDVRRRQLSVYLVTRDATGGARCAVTPLFSDGFENGLDPQWRRPNMR